MSERPQVVCYGHDETLLESRKWVLETRFRTEVITSLEGLRSELSDQGCDLVVLCHSLGADDAQTACDIVKEVSATTKILALIATRSPLISSPCPDQFLAQDGPGALVAKVSVLLGTGAPAAGGRAVHTRVSLVPKSNR